jgi:hypothetical protein
VNNLAPDQEAGVTAHFPDLAKDALGGIGDAEAHVAADVEDRHLDRRYLALDARDQFDHRLLVARIRAEGMGNAAFALYPRHKRRQFVEIAPRHAGDITLAREAARDRAAGGIAGADHENRLLCQDHPSRTQTSRVADRVILAYWFAPRLPSPGNGSILRAEARTWRKPPCTRTTCWLASASWSPEAAPTSAAR